MGSKMEGNKGAWLSVFDFTYRLELNNNLPAFILEGGRLLVAPKEITQVKDADDALTLFNSKFTVGASDTLSKVNKALQHHKWAQAYVEEFFSIVEEIGSSGRKAKMCTYTGVSNKK